MVTHFEESGVNGAPRLSRALYRVILGRYKVLFDEEFSRLLWISRLLALGCAVGILASIIVAVLLLPAIDK